MSYIFKTFTVHLHFTTSYTVGNLKVLQMEQDDLGKSMCYGSCVTSRIWYDYLSVLEYYDPKEQLGSFFYDKYSTTLHNKHPGKLPNLQN